MSRFQRNRDADGRVTPLELFYDLVFVFAITQVSHHLLEHLTVGGAGESLLLLLAVWWSWNYTTWVVNELDPDAIAVRLLLIALMLGSLLMSVAIPDAFGDEALLFAGSYVAIQIGRQGFLTYVASGAGTLARDRSRRILLWFGAAGVFWIGGAVAGGAVQIVLWVVAIALEYVAPRVTYWVPGLPRLPHSAWDLQTRHFAERFQLFIILALGETIVITGATTSDVDLDTGAVAAFGVAFLGTAAFWWLYFNSAATMAEKRLELAGEDRIALARDAYTYLHVVLVAGIIVAAVGDELVIAHPDEVLHADELAVVVAGPFIYLIGHVLFRLRMAGSVSRKRLLGAGACLLVFPLGLVVPGLVTALVLLGILIGVIVAEQLSSARSRRRGEPTPMERLTAAQAGTD